MGVSPPSISGLGDQGPGGGAVSSEAGLCPGSGQFEDLGTFSPPPTSTPLMGNYDGLVSGTTEHSGCTPRTLSVNRMLILLGHFYFLIE